MTAELIARHNANLASYEAARANYRRVVGRDPPFPLHEGLAAYFSERREAAIAARRA